MLLRHLKYLNLRSPLNNTPPSSPERTTRTTFVAKSKADTNISAMARSKQVAGKSPGRQKITKQSARTTKAPVKKARTSKSKGYVFLFNCWMDYYTIAVSIGERDLVDVQKEFEDVWSKGIKISRVDSVDTMLTPDIPGPGKPISRMPMRKTVPHPTAQALQLYSRHVLSADLTIRRQSNNGPPLPSIDIH